MPGSGMPGDRELARRWKAVAGRLCVLGPRAFNSLRDSEALSLEGDLLTISVYAGIASDWLPQAIGDELRREIAAEWGRPLEFRFVKPRTSETPEALFGAKVSSPGQMPLERSNTFAGYMVSAANAEAVCAANRIANREPGCNGNLFVFGDPGVGKTHLLQALAWQAMECGRPALYITWNGFVRRFTTGIRDHTIEAFKQEIRAASLLIIDDFVGATSAPMSAAELQEAMDWVKASAGAVIVASERPPKDLGLPPRLTSRLENGPVIQIRRFDRTERLAFAERYCRAAALALPAWAIERICGMEADSVRVLQGALTTAGLLAGSGALRDEGALDTALATLSLKQSAKESGLDPRAIIERVAQRYRVSPADVQGKGRDHAARDARAVAAVLLTRGGLSQAEAGRYLGNRPRSTVNGILEHGEKLLTGDASLAG